jgi:hypothetical protein
MLESSECYNVFATNTLSLSLWELQTVFRERTAQLGKAKTMDLVLAEGLLQRYAALVLGK